VGTFLYFRNGCGKLRLSDITIDGFVKSPYAVLPFFPRPFGVPSVRLSPRDSGALPVELFTLPFEKVLNWSFYDFITIQGAIMAVIKEAAIPIGRMLFIPKQGNMTKNDLEIEASGQYTLTEMPDRFVVKNGECCRSIMVKVKKKE
jgi:hypothetical protein